MAARTKIVVSSAGIPEQTSEWGKSERPLLGHISKWLGNFLSIHCTSRML